MNLAFCDYIASVISDALIKDITYPGTFLKDTGPIKMDLHPTEGYFVSTKKVINVEDINGKKYTVTIEEESNGCS